MPDTSSINLSWFRKIIQTIALLWADLLKRVWKTTKQLSLIITLLSCFCPWWFLHPCCHCFSAALLIHVHKDKQKGLYKAYTPAWHTLKILPGQFETWILPLSVHSLLLICQTCNQYLLCSWNWCKCFTNISWVSLPSTVTRWGHLLTTFVD